MLRWREVKIPLFFLVIGVFGFFVSGLPLSLVAAELIERFSRNLILVLSLVLPVVAGVGINFALPLGAMAGQLGVVLAVSLNLSGVFAVLAAMGVGLPLAALSGVLTGAVLNRAKGREMIAGLLLGFLASGIYQIVCMILPVQNPAVGLAGGLGIKSTIDLMAMKQGLDNLFGPIFIGMIKIPAPALLLGGLLCAGTAYLLRTKWGRRMFLTGENREAAEALGISTGRMRMLSVVGSMMLAAVGQIVSLQSIGTLNTFGSHEQAGFYAAAALLAGGAGVRRAGVLQAVSGTVLFYLFFLTAPRAAAVSFSDAQIGEYFRVFLAYGTLVWAFASTPPKEGL